MVMLAFFFALFFFVFYLEILSEAVSMHQTFFMVLLCC